MLNIVCHRERKLIMNFKKFFSALTAAALCLTATSCGETENEQVPETAETAAESKKTVKLTLLGGLDTNLELRIADFNKTSEEYEIEVEDRPSSDLAKAIDTLNLEVIAGNTPDIIDGFFLPIESYAEKDLLADYYNFIDNDPEMCHEDFLENVFKAYEINGGLYENISGFNLEAIMGKSSIVGEMQGRTSDDFIDLAEKYPDKNFLICQWTNTAYSIILCVTAGEALLTMKRANAILQVKNLSAYWNFATHIPKKPTVP